MNEKEEEQIYLPKQTPELVTIPKYKYFTISGKGNPNGADFADRVGVLYPLAYAVKMMPKKGVTPNGYFDYTVYPLEGIWDLTDKAKADDIFDKNELVYKIMLRQPDSVTPEVAEMALNHVIAKRDSSPLLGEVVFEEIEDSVSVQMLHIGSFDTESASFEKMHHFCMVNNLKRRDLRHREIYISDFRKTAPEKLKTVLRILCAATKGKTIMEYTNIKQANFISRPNRFIANIEIDGKTEIAHVKNTGRCKELLTPNATVFVQEFDNPIRKTKYDVISVYKESRLINMDSQVPNKVFSEWVRRGNLFENVTLIRPETKYKNSRFDFYIETLDRKIFVEVKGVTLEENGVALFPDAPTERGIKHINELCCSIKDGYEAYIVFIVQMKDVLYFTPNVRTHKSFGDALINAEKQGVNIIALDCDITEDSITARDYVDVRLLERRIKIP